MRASSSGFWGRYHGWNSSARGAWGIVHQNRWSAAIVSHDTGPEGPDLERYQAGKKFNGSIARRGTYQAHINERWRSEGFGSAHPRELNNGVLSSICRNKHKKTVVWFEKYFIDCSHFIGVESSILPALWTLFSLQFWLAGNVSVYTSARSTGPYVIWVCITEFEFGHGSDNTDLKWHALLRSDLFYLSAYLIESHFSTWSPVELFVNSTSTHTVVHRKHPCQPNKARDSCIWSLFHWHLVHRKHPCQVRESCIWSLFHWHIGYKKNPCRHKKCESCIWSLFRSVLHLHYTSDESPFQ